MPRDPDHPVRLTEWIDGVARLHFRGGTVSELPMSLLTAHSLRRQLDEKHGADSIGGLHAHSGWIWARHDEMLVLDWSPAADYGWPSLTVDDRARLETLGMPNGVLQALADLWGTRRHHKASYSINAIAALHTIACREAEVTREVWEQLAEILEGDDGARLARPGAADKERPRSASAESRLVSDRHIDDAAEPSGSTAVEDEKSHGLTPSHVPDDNGDANEVGGADGLQDAGSPATPRSVDATPPVPPVDSANSPQTGLEDV